MIYDFLVIGAGLSGSVFAERAASSRFKVLVIDKRTHIAGNAYDYQLNNNFVHTYGPHYFRTNSQDIYNYLSFFTEWIDAKYEILSYVNNSYWPFPINLNTFEKLIGKNSTEKDMLEWMKSNNLGIEHPKNSKELIISKAGKIFYEMFFENYTKKQWKVDASELSTSVCGRIPIRTDRNNLYFNDIIQKMPKYGYSYMVNNMLDHKNITIALGTEYKSIVKTIKYKKLIFTGPIDEYFEYCLGKLPYRSLRFEIETKQQNFYQPAVQINYPNDFDYTRIVEIKHLMGGGDGTVISKEYPEEYLNTQEPFYPIPTEENKNLYNQYLNLAKKENNTIFLGRLGTYSYLNMDQVVAGAIKRAKLCLM